MLAADLVNVMFRVWLVPSESTTLIGAVYVASVDPMTALALRLTSTDISVVATAGRSPEVGSLISAAAVFVLTFPIVETQPCTVSPVAVCRLPLASMRKSPARV